MAGLDQFVKKQKVGARFVVTAQMLRLPAQSFDTLAQSWIAQGGPGFTITGIPHRAVVDGAFYITRVTAIRSPDDPQ